MTTDVTRQILERC